MPKVSITPKKIATFERWRDNPNFRGVRISPGNSDGKPESLFIKATVKQDSAQNSSHILVHNPLTGKLIYKVCQMNDTASIGRTVQDLMNGEH